MSERSWFSFRYTIPGFIFVFLIFFINLDLIINIVIKFESNLGASIIISVISFLSSPSLGFLITQFWYEIYDFDFSWNRNKSFKKCRSIRKCFLKKYYCKLICKKLADDKSFITDAII